MPSYGPDAARGRKVKDMRKVELELLVKLREAERKGEGVHLAGWQLPCARKLEQKSIILIDNDTDTATLTVFGLQAALRAEFTGRLPGEPNL